MYITHMENVMIFEQTRLEHKEKIKKVEKHNR